MTAVLAIVEEGTFSRAAEVLGVSQPALSKSVALLERRIGSKVFERSPRGSTLTETGRIIARQAESIRIILARTTSEIELKVKGLQGSLNIGATPSVMLSLVPDALSRTLSSNPGLVVHLQEGLDDALTPLLIKGELDLLVGPVGGVHPDPEDLVEIKLADDPYLIGMARDHPLSGRSSLHLRELTEQPWILPIPGSSFHRGVEALFLTAGLTWPTNVLTTNCLYAVDRIVSSSDRIALVSAVQSLSRKSDFVTVPLQDGGARSLGVKVRKRRVASAAAEDFIAHLQVFTRDIKL